MNEIDIITFVDEYLHKHPQAEPRDFYKLAFQSWMGPLHLLDDKFRAKRELEQEFESVAPIEGKVFEELLPGSQLVRVHMRAFKALKGDVTELWKTFELTIKLYEPRPSEFHDAWKTVSQSLKSRHFDIAELNNLDFNSEQNPPQAVHHSEPFRRAESPSYRVVAVKAIEGIGGSILRLFWEEHKESHSADPLPDVANGKPEHEIDIDRVGIEKLQYPIVVLDRDNRRQNTVARVRMSVDLPARWRGTHMSRFVELINRFRGEITHVQIREILDTMIAQFNARSAHMTLEFPYFIEKKAPVSRTPSLMQYNAIFDGLIEDGKYRFKLGVEIPATTLCPCSKELCASSAHSQRAGISIEVIANDFVWIEELIEIGETSASAPVYATLKREDEKFVTEQAYENPRFVEDVVREVAQKISKRADILWFDVRASSEESIHNHSAFARITRSS